jgi:hypothetical protein
VLGSGVGGTMVDEDEAKFSRCSCSGTYSSVGSVWMSILTVIRGEGTGRAFGSGIASVWTLKEVSCKLWLGLHSVVDSEKRWNVLRGAVRVLFKLLESISGGIDDSRSTWYLLQT